MLLACLSHLEVVEDDQVVVDDAVVACHQETFHVCIDFESNFLLFY